MRSVIVLAGPKGAGKSLLAEAISSASSAARVSFGHAVRAIAQSSGLPTDAKSLQDLGQSIVERDPKSLCEKVLSQATESSADSLVIDGLRHRDVLNALKNILAPRLVYVVFIDIAPDEQARRIAKRDGIDMDGVRLMNLHAVEMQLPIIRSMSDMIVDGAVPPQMNTLRVLEALSH